MLFGKENTENEPAKGPDRRTKSEQVAVMIPAREVHLMSDNRSPWENHRRRQDNQENRKQFDDENEKPWHRWNVGQGLIAYMLGADIYNRYLDDAAVAAVGTAALFMSAIAPYVVPFLLGYAGSRALSIPFVTKHWWIYYPASLLLGIAGLITAFAPLGLLINVVAFNVPNIVYAGMMIAGAAAGYTTRHTKDNPRP